ncbi:hypothetical protein D2C82_00875 [Helicobacter pylori]|nr:hypothetical protein BGL56_00295 [Helicobacter pylori]QEF27753.1 hypothetical protein D2C82_00875 [Helicobacter pylori]
MIYIEFKIIFITSFYGNSYAVLVGRKFKACKIGDMLGFLVVVGGYLKKGLGVLSLLSYHVKISFKLALSMSD